MDLLPNKLSAHVAYTSQLRPPSRFHNVLNEDNLQLISTSGHWWARGYFQDPSLFWPLRDVLRQEIRAAFESAVPTNSWRLEQPYAAVHVRRGDYVTMQKITDRLGICTLNYFGSAIADLDPNLPAIIVSDDPGWCSETLRHALDRPVRVMQTGSDLADLLLLMGAKQLVMSNSTFSWWGAFAGYADRVVGPDRFFDAPDAGGARLAGIADIHREKSTGLLTVRSD
ncbi:alpha-1,2-fucosyltransferase [Mycolicibacterium austroafricanum]|nr:alpha-1,2-fucosyltransferase [Mycolicibacterium austroafricanum]QZT69988.1 alpha-1,2-fucosyltransferase [Mycolicibacterium austroafricanum]